AQSSSGQSASTVAVEQTAEMQAMETQATAVANDPAQLPAGVDYTVAGMGEFVDISSAFSFSYGRTSFDEADNRLYAGLTVDQQQDANAFLRGRLLLAVSDISAPGVVLIGADGYTKD